MAVKSGGISRERLAHSVKKILSAKYKVGLANYKPVDTNNLIPEDKEVGDLKAEGLKTVLIRQLKSQVESLLNKTDWYVVRKADTAEAIPSSVATHRAAVRTKQAEMETAITNASDTAALETLYTYTTTDGVTSRPLGELPTLG